MSTPHDHDMLTDMPKTDLVSAGNSAMGRVLLTGTILHEAIHVRKLIVVLLVHRQFHNPADHFRELLPDEVREEREPHVGARRHPRRRPGVSVHDPARTRHPVRLGVVGLVQRSP